MNRFEAAHSFTSMPSDLPERLEQKVRYLFTDVDDTLTWQGKLPSQTLQALEQLQEASIQVIPVTGACAGWCDCMVRTWPVAAVIGENGAFWMQKNAQGHVDTHYMLEESIRRQQYQNLLAIQQQLLERYPFARATADQAYRETDIALDIHQQHHNTPEEVEILRGDLVEAGLNARVSSIHINAWRGGYDKASTTFAWLRTQGIEHEQYLQQSAFIGDSANDAAMFDQLTLTFGVANIRHCLNKLSTPPRYITQHEGGFGFVEVASLLLSRSG
ncbi:HAD-IIB family hydrolase [Nitrincola sp. MINF-07-Sa-05]|uniref:HAD-IIB family hydrolase n=1 Tax=Nitrincola salilacus TaxID=3400273 RepID=UPI00391818D1